MISIKRLPFGALAGLLLMAAPAQADIIQFRASLSGPAEDPPNTSPGVGWAIVSYDDVGHTLRVQAAFSGLVGDTRAAHIHAPTAVPSSGTAGVATTIPSFPGFPLGVKAGTFDQTYNLLSAGSYNPSFLNNLGGGIPAGAEAALVNFMLEGRAYFNIHSTEVPAGEIRGFLAQVPDTSSNLACLASR